jgi:hypothetical protein
LSRPAFGSGIRTAVVRTDQRYLADAGRRLDAITLHGSFGEALAFVAGYDAARASSDLGGFQRWLATRAGASSSAAIAELILATPGVDGDDGKATAALFRLLDEYLASRDAGRSG